MTFQTPGAPAAKRRRIEAANATLRKPFRSPMLSRKDDQPGSESKHNSPTITQESPATKVAPQTPTTPAPARGYRPPAASPLSSSSSSHDRSPSTAGPKTYTSQQPRHRVKSDLGSGATTKAKATTTSQSSEQDDNDLLHRLHLSQAHLTTLLRSARTRLDVARQARRIEQTSSSSTTAPEKEGRLGPREPVDAELRTMTAQWRTTSRLAAEELFGIIRERVEGIGGARAWRATRQWQRNGGPFSSWGLEGGNAGSDGEERERVREQDEQKEEEEVVEAEESEFTMPMMLKSLNIEPGLLGYDPDEEKWHD
ncbi:hypothetical protein VTI28DRAFT_2370 [Corynascus sepedonium]